MLTWLSKVGEREVIKNLGKEGRNSLNESELEAMATTTATTLTSFAYTHELAENSGSNFASSSSPSFSGSVGGNESAR